MNDDISLCPLLVVRGAAQAIAFYQRALGARVLARYEHGPERRISHADLALGEARFSLTEELRERNGDAPVSLGGSPVVLQLAVADASATVAALCAAGAVLVFPLQTFAGERMARVRDPFGHLWLLRQQLEQLTAAEIQRRRDELFAQLPAKDAGILTSAPTAGQAPSGAPTPEGRGARVHLVLGPVGAGKSTYSQELARERSALRLTLDDWMVTLFSPDRPETGLTAWYAPRAQRCVDQIWKVARQVTDQGREVVLELGLIRREERERFYPRIDELGLPLTLHVLEASREVRRERVRERNRTRGQTFSMVVSPEIFELASDLWQPLDSDECDGRDLRRVRTDAG